MKTIGEGNQGVKGNTYCICVAGSQTVDMASARLVTRCRVQAALLGHRITSLLVVPLQSR